MILDDILDARILVEIGRRLAFGAAADALGVPAATVSRRVARMERAAGIKLFERTTRTVTPTEAGMAAVELAARVVEAAGTLDAVMEGAGGEPRGTVRVTAMHDMANTLLPPVTERFLRECPGCQLVVGLVDEDVDLVAEGVDVAIRAMGPGTGNPIARKLGAVRLRLHARPEVAATVRSVDDLMDRRFGFFGAPSEMRGTGPVPHSLVLHDTGGPPRLVPVEPSLKANDFGLLRTTALASDLIVGLPTVFTTDDVAAGTLVRVLPDLCHTDIDLFAVMPSRTHVRPAVRAFMDIAARTIRDGLREADRGDMDDGRARGDAAGYAAAAE